MIEGSVPDLGLDGQVVLSIDGIAAKLKGVVARKDPDATLLTLDLLADAAKVVRTFVTEHEAA